jgi:hypothetical protein
MLFFLYWQFDLTVLPLLSYESSRKLVALRARKRSLLGWLTRWLAARSMPTRGFFPRAYRKNVVSRIRLLLGRNV